MQIQATSVLPTSLNPNPLTRVRGSEVQTPDNATPSEQVSDDNSTSPSNNPSALTEQEQQQLRELKARDREVRAHEAAHLAAAGSLAQGGPTYTYQRGPDGVLYAVGGEVNIDTSAVEGDPEATLEKAQRIRTAALAPAEPSAQDLRVAAQAAQLAIQARADINEAQRQEEAEAQKEAEETATNEISSEVQTNGGQTRPSFTINAIPDLTTPNFDNAGFDAVA